MCRRCVQSTQSCITWSGEGGATAGKPTPAADIEFYLDVDVETGVEMVHIAEPKPQRRQPEFLVKDIQRYFSFRLLWSFETILSSGQVCPGLLIWMSVFN